ncbi:MAG TPA: glucosamine-6-phosphate deaminase [Puia sp.]|nr:glucosamine-6-phosphate deaminase [Puia sp.]
MKLIIQTGPAELGRSAGQLAGKIIREAIERRNEANIVLATGTSQFETLTNLTRENIPWYKVSIFHLDEYIGLPATSPASFRRYLRERFVQMVGKLREAYFINGEDDPLIVCRELSDVISKVEIDIAMVGIGENGHLGFNDPPADFNTTQPFIQVNLDERCRQQQFGEGWFASLDEVPRTAITMSIRQIMKSRQIICSVPEARKAEAVKNCFERPPDNNYPASILQDHKACSCFLDLYSSALLTDSTILRFKQNPFMP